MREQYSNVTLDFLYGVEDEVVGFTYNGTPYYYRKNLQGDVIGILNQNGEEVAAYTYDAWGKPLTVTGDTVLANVNPIRYRSYYYDTETSLYYLNSRYYDPDTCRFINADDTVYLLTSEKRYNLFEYCFNNPINFIDDIGYAAGAIYSALSVAYAGLKIGQKTLQTMIKKAYWAVGSFFRMLIVVGVIVLAIAAIFIFCKQVEKIIKNAKKLEQDDYENYINQHCVYMLKRKSDDKIFYVGISVNIEKRIKTHKIDPEKPEFIPYLVDTCKTRASSRVLEQILINSLGLVELSIAGSNKIRSIAKKLSNRIKYKSGIADMAEIYFNKSESDLLLAAGM